MLTGTIYGLFDTNVPDEFRYIGQTRNLKKRLGEHTSRSRTSNIRVYCWWRSATVESIVLAKQYFNCEFEMKAWLDSQETALIEAYRTAGHRLTNLTNGGEGTVGQVASEMTRIKQRQAHLGKTHSSETKLKMSGARGGDKHHFWGKPGPNLGKTMSDDSKQKLSESRLGIGAKLTDEQVTLILLDWRTQKEIADDYGVSRSYVSQIKSGVRNTENRKCG